MDQASLSSPCCLSHELLERYFWAGKRGSTKFKMVRKWMAIKQPYFVLQKFLIGHQASSMFLSFWQKKLRLCKARVLLAVKNNKLKLLQDKLKCLIASLDEDFFPIEIGGVFFSPCWKDGSANLGIKINYYFDFLFSSQFQPLRQARLSDNGILR